jgi:hypothetical protein
MSKSHKAPSEHVDAVHDDRMLGLIDAWLLGLPEERFTAVLPLLQQLGVDVLDERPSEFARADGLRSREEIREMMVHAFLYCGIPLMVDAMRASEEVLDELAPEKKLEATNDRIGFVGLGNMGAPMAANLVRGGYEVTAHDIALERAKNFATTHNAHAAETLAALEVLVGRLDRGQWPTDMGVGFADYEPPPFLRPFDLAWPSFLR